jgi:hypothetical protein
VQPVQVYLMMPGETLSIGCQGHRQSPLSRQRPPALGMCPSLGPVAFKSPPETPSVTWLKSPRAAS